MLDLLKSDDFDMKILTASTVLRQIFIYVFNMQHFFTIYFHNFLWLSILHRCYKLIIFTSLSHYKVELVKLVRLPLGVLQTNFKNEISYINVDMCQITQNLLNQNLIVFCSTCFNCM